MKASETNLREIIEGTKQYIIPMFQRTYSWGRKQWNTLWEDIIELIDENPNQSHFIGSIVSIPINANTHGIQQFLVIDGQQRLTTLFILLAAARDAAAKQGHQNLADEIHNTLLINSYKSGEEVYKFLPTQTDKEFFKRIVMNQISSRSEESRITNAYYFFYDTIEKEMTDVSALKTIITSSLSIVSIVLSPDDNPYLVFESLNAKGQPLTQADLIRNYLFMRIPADEQEGQYTRYWLPMQEELGEELTEFIRHYLMGINTNVKKSDVYLKFKERVDSLDVISFLASLSKFASYYTKLLKPNIEDHVAIRKYLKRINEFEAKTAYPFLLYIYRDYEENKYNASQLSIILKIIENYLVRRFVCNIDSKSLNNIFAAMYNQISMYEADQSIEEIASYLQNRSYPKDLEFTTSLKVNHFYGQGDRRKKGAYILRAIESSFSHKEPVALKQTTVEHIMPQVLTETWLKELGENGEVIHSTYLHRLGNLTLTGYNSELSNKPFTEKKEYFKTSNIQMNKEIALFQKWNNESIEKREDELIDKTKDIWPYFGKEENEIKIITGTSPRLLVFLDQPYIVKSWRDLMEKTLLALYDNNKVNYQKIMDKYPRFLAVNNKEMRKGKLLENGHYLEVNLNAKSIYDFCKNAVKEAGYNEGDWRVEIEKR